jgi:hypothetical protein
VPADSFDLYLSLGVARHEPETLEISVRGRLRKGLSAFWNGCPWVL